MKPAANTSVSDQNTIQPTKTGALLGKLGQMKSTAIAAIAALGLASSAEAQSQNQTIPSVLTHSPLTLQPGASSNILHTTTISGVDLRINTPATGAGRGIQNIPYQGTSRVSVTIPSDKDGILTISWNAEIGTGSAPGTGSALGFANTTFNVDLRVRLGLNGGSMNEINFFDGPAVLNGSDEASGISTTEGYNLPQSFTSQNINVLKGQTYNLDFSHEAVNANTFSQIKNLQFSFRANVFIPPPDTNINNIPDSWEMQHLGMLSPADGDPDKDGMNNLMEYALNTDPMVFNPSPITCTIQDGYLILSFPRNPLATNLNYTVEGTNDLKLWGEVERVAKMTQTTVTDIVPVSSTPTRFLRLKIEPK